MTKSYTFNEAMKLPPETTFTDGTRKYRFVYEHGYRELVMIDQNGIFCYLEVPVELTLKLMVRDDLRVVDCKHEETKPRIGIQYNAGDDWDRWCVICEEKLKDKPSRIYVTLGEALANVATGKWEWAAYDNDAWRERFKAICFNSGIVVKEWIMREAVSEPYSDARWYNPDEGL